MVSLMHLVTRCTFMLAFALALGGSTSARAAQPTPEARARATELGQQAKAARDALRYAEAAALLDEAHRLQPDARWLGLSGECRMMAGELERAIADLSAALKDPRLPRDARVKAEERLSMSKDALAAVRPAEEARARGGFEAAAQGFDRAFQIVPTGIYLAEAGLLWERAGQRDLAEARLREASARADLPDDRPRLVADALSRIEASRMVGKPSRDAAREEPPAPARPPPVERPEGSSPVLGWVLVGTGVAALGLGVAGFVMSEGKRAEFESDQEYYRAHLDEWTALDDEAETWWNVGLVSSGVGLAAAVTGVVLVITHEGSAETEGTVHVGAHAITGGTLVTATGRF